MEPNPAFASRTASEWSDPQSEALPSTDQAPDLTTQWEQYFAAVSETKTPIGGVLLTLPSGLQVRAKRPHLILLMKEGRIPDALTPLVQRMITLLQNGLAEGPVKAVQEDYENDEAKSFNQFCELLDTVWVNAVVEPMFVRNPVTQRGAAKPGEKVYPVSAVKMDDKLFLFTWCQGVSDDLAAFRAGQDRVAEALSKGQNVFEIALSIARDNERERELAGLSNRQRSAPVGRLDRHPGRAK